MTPDSFPTPSRLLAPSILFAALALSGCPTAGDDDDDDDDAPFETTCAPLLPVDDVDLVLHYVSEAGGGHVDDRIEQIGETEFEGEELWTTRRVGSGTRPGGGTFEIEELYYYRCDDEGVHRMGRDWSLDEGGRTNTQYTVYTTPLLLMTPDAAEGDSWRADFAMVHDGGDELVRSVTIRVGEVETLDLPYGSLDAQHVSEDAGGYTFERWYAPDLGLVSSFEGELSAIGD